LEGKDLGVGPNEVFRRRGEEEDCGLGDMLKLEVGVKRLMLKLEMCQSSWEVGGVEIGVFDDQFLVKHVKISQTIKNKGI
jgi:hypothetical protein